MSDLKQAAQQALEAWRRPNGINYYDFVPYMDALEKALAQQAEPVAWRDPSNAYPGQGCTYKKAIHEKWPYIYSQALYTAPPRREWVPLTEDDFPPIRDGDTAFRSGALWADRLLKEKNHG